MAELSLKQVEKRFGDRVIIQNLDLHVKSGEMVCLLGPSGSGKTTILRMIGGFIMANSGVITIDEQPVTDLTPERRPTAMVFQQYALWPNMTVFQNIAFGLKIRKLSRTDIRRKVDAALDLVDLNGLDRYYPAQLSGGQQQRVALARALVLEPKVLLLDEPLSNLDAQLRYKVREEIREIQQRAGITTVFVTHDQDEALSVSDRVAVLFEGRIEQFDTPDNLYLTPRTSFVAKFIGSMNVFRGSVQGGLVHATAVGVARGAPSAHGVSIAIPYDDATAETRQETELGVRPEDIVLTEDGHGAKGTVTRRVPRGHYAELLLETAFGEVRAFVPNHITAADTVSFRFQRVLVYENERLVLASSHALTSDAEEEVVL